MSLLRIVGFVVVCAGVGACACGGPPVQPDAGTNCAIGQSACNGVCTDTTTDSANCGACAKACTSAQSCIGGTCYSSSCSDATCTSNQVCNGGACVDRRCLTVSCNGTEACYQGMCVPKMCATMSCDDGFACVQGSCIDVTCNGVICPGTKACYLGRCNDCGDGLQSGGESDIDCGRFCPNRCADGKKCDVQDDCAGAACDTAHICRLASCNDGMKNGTESDTDCGRFCPSRCADNKLCVDGSDCVSAQCGDGGTCIGAGCNDGLKNGSETDIDCGGSCTTKCRPGQACVVPADCVSNGCTNLTCDNPCINGTEDGMETDLDCGGPICPPCANGLDCVAARDCTSGVCTALTCTGASCTDVVKNQDETAVDCGGTVCGACDGGLGCLLDRDCTSMSCVNLSCASGNCTNGTMQPCGSNVGVCTLGMRTCTNGAYGLCIGGVQPGPEICDGLDNDCDGVTDPGCGCPTGQWFSEPVYTTGSTGGYPSLAIDRDGGLHVGFYDTVNTDVRYAYHAPNGFWIRTPIDTTNSVGTHPSMIQAPDGTLHAVYFDNTLDNLKYATKPPGGSWTTTTIGDSSLAIGEYSSIARDTQGGLWVSTYDNSNDDLVYLYKPADAGWSSNQVVDNGGLNGVVGLYTSIGIDSNDGVHIAYYDTTNTALKYAYRAKGAVSWDVQPLDGTADSGTTNTSVGTHASLAIDQANGVHVAYYSTTNTDLRYVYKPPTGAFQLSIPADTNANDVGQWAAIAVEGGANPTVHIAYWDATAGAANNNLKYITRTGGAFSIPIVIDGPGNVGQGPAIAVSNGAVYISYYDASNNDLKLAVKPSGAPSFFIVPVETKGTSGAESAIVVNAAGDVNIIYYDGTAGSPGQLVKEDLIHVARKAGGWWTSEVAEASTADIGMHNDVAVANDGTVHLTYYEGGAAQNLRHATRTTGAWSSEAAITTSNVGQHSNVCVDKSGTVSAAYYDATLQDALFATRDQLGAWVPLTNGIQQTNNVGQFLSAACDPDGGVFASYYDGTATDLRFAYKLAGQTAFTTQPLDTGGTNGAGTQTSLAMTPSWEPRIAYYSADRTDLMLASRTGTAWAYYTVDFNPLVGTTPYNPSPSAAVQPNGVALVAYNQRRLIATTTVNIFMYELRVAAQTLSDGGFSSVIADDTGTVNGVQSTMAFDPSGMAHILYYDPTNQDLRHAFRCP